VIRSDNELAKGMATRKWLKKSGITFEPSPSHIQDLNGVSERIGGVIFMKGRCMRVQARLPHKLWREAINAAVYLHNRTPRAKNRWVIPYTLFHGYLGERDGIEGSHTPETAHLKAYGCVAYAAITTYKRGLSKLRKLDPRADVGYLVGYDSTNIYRIWIPHQGRVISTRDVIFDESKFFNGRKKQMTTLKMLELDDLVQKVELPDQVAQNEAVAEEDNEGVFEPIPEFEATGASEDIDHLSQDVELAKALDNEFSA
jgi:hypothetical protein